MHRFAIPLATLVVLAVNAAANLVPLNGMTTGELSARYPTGFTPAGWVFSIWSLIYAGLIAFSVWAFRSANASARLESIRVPYYLSCAANAGWILVWHYERVLASVVVMLVLLASLAVLYARLRRQPPSSAFERWCVDLPFSVYFGWITAATIVNFATWLYAAGDYPFALSQDAWALASVTIAVAIYASLGGWLRDPLYTAVFVWAALGIVYRTAPTDEAVRLAAAAGGAAVALLTLLLIGARGFGRARRAY